MTRVNKLRQLLAAENDSLTVKRNREVIEQRAAAARKQSGTKHPKDEKARDLRGRFCKQRRRVCGDSRTARKESFKGPTYLQSKTRVELIALLIEKIERWFWLRNALAKSANQDISNSAAVLAQPLWLKAFEVQKVSSKPTRRSAAQDLRLQVLNDVLLDLRVKRDDAGVQSPKLLANLMTARFAELFPEGVEDATGRKRPIYVHASSLFREPFRSQWFLGNDDAVLDGETARKAGSLKNRSREYLIRRYLQIKVGVDDLELLLLTSFSNRFARSLEQADRQLFQP